MTNACMEYVKGAIEKTHCTGNVNGRERFPLYIGIDMRDGPEVDQVASGHYIPRPDFSFGVVVSTEMLEHDNRFWLSLAEMHRVLQPGGTIILTTRGIEYPRHDYPSDYYRFTAEGLKEAMIWAGFKEVESEENATDKGVYATGRV